MSLGDKLKILKRRKMTKKYQKYSSLAVTEMQIKQLWDFNQQNNGQQIMEGTRGKGNHYFLLVGLQPGAKSLEIGVNSQKAKNRPMIWARYTSP